MAIELDSIRGKELIQCSYSEAVEIVEALETVNPFHYSGISAIEKMETYRSHAYILKERILNNEFREIAVNDRRRDRNNILSRLNLLIESFSSSLKINGILAEQEAQVSELFKKAKGELENERTDIKRTADEVRNQIDNSEHKILTHVLSLMGIFSAIITLIMSMVITSSYWLNNANGASAIIAFIIPNLVTLIAVFTLLSLIFFYLHRDTSVKGEKCAVQKRSLAFTISIVALLLCVILCCWFCLSAK